MSVTIVSVYLKTESGDGYLYLFDQLANPDEFIELLEYSMGDEFDYVWAYDIEVMYGDKEIYEQALRDAINGENE